MIRKLLSASLISCSIAAGAVEVPPPNVVLQGVMVGNQNWTSAAEAGIYNIDVRPGGAITAQHKNEAMANIVAAINHNGTLYAVETDNSGIYYHQFSTSTWASKSSREEIDDVNVPSDLTYDAVTGKVYGGFWDAEYGGFSRFATFGLTTAEASDVKGANRDERDIFAVAAAPDGTVYALFGAYNYLATINTKNGALERIGRTGLDIDANPSTGSCNSMCYDSANDRLLAVVHHEVGPRGNKTHYSALYSIDPRTAAAEKIMDIPGGACFAGLMILSDTPSATAPSAARNLTAGGDKIEFDVPTQSIGGAPLSGPLMAVINLNGSENVMEGIAPGSHVTVDGQSFIDGINTVKVTLATSTERGETATLEFRNGEDVPTAVTNLSLKIADGTATLSWDAPTTGANGGTLTPSKLLYRIVRYPNGKTMAEAHTGTSFTDTSINPGWKSIYYTVTAYNTQGEATAVSSNRCPGSGALGVPYEEGFDTADDFAAWTVIDLNGSATWKYDSSKKSALYDFPRDATPGDDWLISPPVKFESGKTYKVSYDYRAYSKSYKESFEVAFLPLGTLENAQVIATYTDFNDTSFKRGEASFKADKDYQGSVAFHATSKPNMWSIYIDNVLVEAIDSRVPAEVSDLSATAAAEGALKASLSFTAPSTDTDGGALVGLTKIEIFRSGTTEAIAVFDNPATGATMSYEDAAVPAAGTYTYSVVCHNAAGSSLAATVEVFVGVDSPGAVRNLSVSEKDGKPYLRWEAPVIGTNGGWFDASALSYRIVRSDGTVIAESCTETEFLDSAYTVPATSQDAVWYLVTPYCGSTKGSYAQSDLFLIGKPYTTPASETFAGIDMVYYPWITQSWDFPTQNWTLDAMGYNPSCSDYTGDGGLATFHSVGEKAGTTSWYYSPMFDISALDAPELSFYMYHTPDIAGDATLEIYATDGGDFESTGIIIRRDDAEASGWVRHTVDLSAFKGATHLRVAFKGTADGNADIYIDGIGIDSVKADDIAVSAFNGPSKLASGCPGTFNIVLLNSGKNAVNGATLTISDGANTLFTLEGIEIAPGTTSSVSAELSFETTGSRKLTASAAMASDSDASNNSMELTVKVVAPVIPRPQNLTATESPAGALLSWEAPDSKGAVCDDFESYPDYAITGIGDWTMYDGDNAPTYYINMSSVGEYPNASAPKAFQLLNSATLGIDIWEQGKPHSGNKMLAAMASIGFVNDDWLISPMLNGSGQWISFWARSFTTDGIAPERMKVLTSKTGTNPADFTAITENYIELDGTWREYRYWMPEGTRHFAINCVSDDSFALFVDDVCFNDMTVPVWSVSGYEVLRDGAVIATVETPGYVDKDAVSGAVYTVRAVYSDKGKSAESDAAEYTVSGVTLPRVEDAEVEAVYTPAGTRVEGKPGRGVYIIRYTDGHAEKKIF